MPDICRIRDPYCLHLAGVIRDETSTPSQIREALSGLGAEIGRHIIEIFHLVPTTVVTPVNDVVDVLRLADVTSLVVTTKSDLDSFGKACSARLSPSRIGYMNFEGRRGLEALNTPVREIDLPATNATFDTLVVAKSTLATGCTAISLTQKALEEVTPTRLVIATIFHSLEGLQELTNAFPQATIICVGEPDTLDSNGMLHPGIGLLDDRI